MERWMEHEMGKWKMKMNMNEKMTDDMVDMVD